jgi:hypothetical protein
MSTRTVKLKHGPDNLNIDARLAPLIKQLWKHGIDTLQCSHDWGRCEACIELTSSAGVEAFLNLVGAAAACHAEVEIWNDGEEEAPSFRCRLLVCFPTANLARMIEAAKSRR